MKMAFRLFLTVCLSGAATAGRTAATVGLSGAATAGRTAAYLHSYAPPPVPVYHRQGRSSFKNEHSYATICSL